MAERDKNGRFIKGHGGGPGRPKKEREARYLEIMLTVVDPVSWMAICTKAAEQAEQGDKDARKWLADYLIGPPVQKNEHTGSDGKPIKIVVKLKEDD